jgi:DNA polymerase III subunit delta
MKEFDRILDIKRKELKTIYLIYGEERYLLDEFIKKFIDKFKINEFNLSILEDDDDDFFLNLKNKTNTLPVMTDKRFIILKAKKYFTKNNNEDESLIRLFSNFSESTVLLISVYGRINNKLKLVKTIAKYGEIIELSPPKYRELEGWIKEKFLIHGKEIDNEGIKLLEQMFNNELQCLNNEIEKIITYKYNCNKISYQDIMKIISKDRLLEDSIIFSFVDALSEKKRSKAIIILNEMINNGESPLKLLAMIVRQLRLLILVKVLKRRKIAPNQIAKILKEHPYPVKKVYKQCDNFNEKELEIMLEKCLEANLFMLTGRYKDNRMALEMIILEKE